MVSNSTYQFGAVPPDLLQYVKDKGTSSKCYFEYFLTRTKTMFQYKNLPDTIEASMLERYLQVNGICCITKYHDKLFAFNGSMGGEQDVYYRPTLFVVSNPHLDNTFFKNVIVSNPLCDYNNQPTDSQPGVLMRNDDEWMGLSPLIARYSVLLAENCLTIRSADIMLRIVALLTASSDKGMKSAEAYLRKLEKGELGFIGDSAFTENAIKMQSPPSNNGSYLTQFIELHQYLIGSFFNELGLRANYNMKREAIGQGESSMDEDAIMPLCDNMLKARKEDLQKVNDFYGTDISVDYSSAWLDNAIQRRLTILSQLSESSAGQVETDKDQVGSGMGQNGSTPENSEGDENGNGDDTFGEEGHITGEDGDNSSEGSGEGSGEENREPREDSGESEEAVGERSADTEAAEGTDSSSGGDAEESGGGVLDDSSNNDLVVDPLTDRVESYLNDVQIEKKSEPNQLMEGGENGFLGETESSGNEDDNSGD